MTTLLTTPTSTCNNKSSRYWYEQLLLYIKVGRIKYLPRLAHLYNVLHPCTPPQPAVLQVCHGRVYVPNPFIRATIQSCMQPILTKFFTLKRVLSALATGDFSGIVIGGRLSPPQGVPLVPFLLSLVYIHLVQADGDVVVEIEEALLSAKNFSFPSYTYVPFSLSPSEMIDLIIERRLRFIEGPSPSDACCAVYLNELLEQVHLIRWIAEKNVKTVLKSVNKLTKRVMPKKKKTPEEGAEAEAAKRRKNIAEAELHNYNCFGIINRYHEVSNIIVLAHLRHLLRMHPILYLSSWKIDYIAILVKILHTSHLSRATEQSNDMESLSLRLLSSWATEIRTVWNHRNFLQYDKHRTMSLLSSTVHCTRNILASSHPSSNPHFALCIVWLSLIMGLMEGSACNDVYEMITSPLRHTPTVVATHPKLSMLFGAFRYVLAAVEGDKLGDMIHLVLTLWSTHSADGYKVDFPPVEHALGIHKLFRTAVILRYKTDTLPDGHSNSSDPHISRWLSTLCVWCHSLWFETENEPTRFIAMFAASGILKGIDSLPKISSSITVRDYIQQSSLCNLVLLNGLSLVITKEPSAYLHSRWPTGAALAITHGGQVGLTSLVKNHDLLPEALLLVINVFINDAFGEWLVNSPLDSKFVDKAEIHKKGALFGASGMYTDLLMLHMLKGTNWDLFLDIGILGFAAAQLFTSLAPEHPAGELALQRLWKYAGAVFEMWRGFGHRTAPSFREFALFPVVQSLQMTISMFLFYSAKQSGICFRPLEDTLAFLDFVFVEGSRPPSVPSQTVVRLVEIIKNSQSTTPNSPLPQADALLLHLPLPASISKQKKKDDKATIARMCFLLSVIALLGCRVSPILMRQTLIPLCFVLIGYNNPRLCLNAHVVLKQLMECQPVEFAQELVPQYIRIALENYPSLTNAVALADSLSVILRRMPPPVALLAVRAVSARVEQIVSPVSSQSNASSYPDPHAGSLSDSSKLLLDLFVQIMLVVDASLLDVTLEEIEKVAECTKSNKATRKIMLEAIHRCATGNMDYTRKTHITNWYIRFLSGVKSTPEDDTIESD